MENTVVAVYDSYSEAQNAMNDLLASGFSRHDMRLHPDSEPSAASGHATTHDAGGSGIGHFFRSLFGMEDQGERTQTAYSDTYSEAVRRGSIVLSLDVENDEQMHRAEDIMNRYDPVDIDERSSDWRSRGWTGYEASAPMMSEDEIRQERSRYAPSSGSLMRGASANPAGDVTAGAAGQRQTTAGETERIPVVQEELQVGKREVQRGGVRVFKRVKETPVHEAVNLREERVKVERHPVDQPATEADLAAFKEGSVEMREMAEEPVVSKEARVVEEVVVSKDVTQEKANIEDTVRRTDVEVEQLGAGRTASGTMSDDADYRRHWQTAYGQSGGRYEDYDAAYRYGSTMAGTERFSNYRWDDAEPKLRSDWEAHHPESTWDKVKDAVRYGAERVKGSARH